MRRHLAVVVLLFTAACGGGGDVWDCETRTNVVSSDRCQKNITRECRGGDELNLTLVAEFHQESPTRIAFTFDERYEAPYFACSGRYYGTITKQ